jgi:hypothetical protein
MFQILKGMAIGLIMVVAAFAIVSSPSVLSQSLVPNQSEICGKAGCPVTGTNEVGTVTQNRLVEIIINVARFLTFIGVGLSVLFMVWGGIRYITAGGSDGSSEGKNTLINATIGLVVSIVAFTVVNILASILSGNVAGNLLG